MAHPKRPFSKSKNSKPSSDRNSPSRRPQDSRASFRRPEGVAQRRSPQSDSDRGHGFRGQSRNGRWVVGLHSCREVVRVRSSAVQELWLKQGWEASQDLRGIAESIRITPKVVSATQIDKMSGGNQGVALFVSESPELNWENLNADGPALVLLADGIQDPHNLGAILRTAWLLNVSALFITEHRSSPLTPTALKVASGGAEYVPVIADENLIDVIKRLKDMGFWVYGLAGEASLSLWSTQFPEKVALVIGSEESGLRSTVAKVCDELIKIPQANSAASFNASVAAGMALSEVRRQLTDLVANPK